MPPRPAGRVRSDGFLYMLADRVVSTSAAPELHGALIVGRAEYIEAHNRYLLQSIDATDAAGKPVRQWFDEADLRLYDAARDRDRK